MKDADGRSLCWYIPALLSVVIAFAALLFGTHAVGETVKLEAMRCLDEVAAQCVNGIRMKIDSDFTTLRGMAGLIGRGGKEIYARENLEVLGSIAASGGFEAISVVTPDGTRYSYDRQMEDLSLFKYIDRVFQGEEVVSDLVVPWDDAGCSVVLGTPIYRDGRVVGGLFARYREESFNRLLSANLFGGEGYHYLAKTNGEIFARSNHPDSDPNFHNYFTDFADVSFDTATTFRTFQKRIAEGESGAMCYTWNGTRRYMSYRPIGVNGWYLLTVAPDRSVSTETEPLLRLMMAAGAFLSALPLVLLLYLMLMKSRNRQSLEKAQTELRVLSDSIPGGFLRCSTDKPWRIDYASDGFLKIIGYTRAEFCKRFEDSFCHTICRNDRERVMDSIREQFERGSTAREEYRVTCKDGICKWMHARCQLVPYGGHTWMYCVLMDCTKIKQDHDASQHDHALCRAVLEQTGDIVFDWNIVEHTVSCSDQFYQKFGYLPISEDFPHNVRKTGSIHEKDWGRFLEIFKSLEAGAPYAAGEIRFCDSQKHSIWCRVSAVLLQDKNGAPERAIGLIADIDKEKRALEKCGESAMRDPLTGLYHRGALRAAAQEALSGGNAPQAALLLLNIDNFNTVYQNMGRIYCDAVLSEMARSMAQLAPEGVMLGYWGGDEFAAFFAGAHSGGELRACAETLSGAIRRPYAGRHGTSTITCSIGAASCPGDGETFDALLSCAEAALRFIKRREKGGLMFYCEEVRAEEAAQTPPRHPRAAPDEPGLYRDFQTHMSEYVFEILYHHQELHRAISVILDLIGRHFGASRAFIFEKCAGCQAITNTFEWCAEGVAGKKESYRQYPVDDWARFDHSGEVFHIADVAGSDESYAPALREYDVASMLVCNIFERGEWKACLGFDQCGRTRYLEHGEAETLSFLAKIICTFLLKERAQETLAATRET